MTSRGGTHTLVVTLREPVAIGVGALGTVTFPVGGYAYTGSALGGGGFSRVDRHRTLADGNNDTRHWHIDYLLGHSATRFGADVTTAERDVECAVAARLSSGPVRNFGATDCNCQLHLTHRFCPAQVVADVHEVHDTV